MKCKFVVPFIPSSILLCQLSSLAGEEVLRLRAALPLVAVVRVEVEAVVDVDLLPAAHRTNHPDHLVVLKWTSRKFDFRASTSDATSHGLNEACNRSTQNS